MKPITLYIKKCSHCSLRYFGKTIKNNPKTYKGSGLLWRKHLKVNNAKSVHVSHKTFEDIDKATNVALRFSKMFNIVESNKWANLIEENAIEGWIVGRLRGKNSKEHNIKIGQSKVGNTYASFKRTKEQCHNMSEARKKDWEKRYKEKWVSPLKGTKMSEQAKQRMRVAALKRTRATDTKV